MKIAVSFLKSVLSKEETIKKIEQTSADFIHVDLSDGLFVKDNNFEVIKLLKNHKKPLDIHLMTNEVEPYLKDLIPLKPTCISFHLEAPCDIKKTIETIKKENIKVGLAINPETKIETLKDYLNEIDQVIIMSVTPGLGGQPFIENTIPKLKELNELKKNHHFNIMVDGGINDQTIHKVKDYVDIIVSGYFICKEENYEEQINKLK